MIGTAITANISREQIEDEIAGLVANETRASVLSERLFDPSGLFGQLASTETERAKVVLTPLFRRAQRRLSDLQRAESIRFTAAIQGVQTAQDEEPCLVAVTVGPQCRRL